MVRGQLPLIKEMKNKANLQFHFMPILLAKLKHICTDTHTSSGKAAVKVVHSYTAGNISLETSAT